ncbi:MAG: hypothetical protein FWG11_02765, partial [Promicromonosporaceae bacterium]|nr:hypothetical protein [Promicromonosporaceae bacterium]
NDEAARAHHMNRSEFYTRAAAQLRDQEQEGVAEINDMVARFGQRDAAEVRAEANRVLEDVIW